MGSFLNVYSLTGLSRIDDELPNGPHLGQNDAKLSSLELRFTRLENKFDDLSTLLRSIIGQSGGPSSDGQLPIPKQASKNVPKHSPDHGLDHDAQNSPQLIPEQRESLQSPSDSESEGDDGPSVPQPLDLVKTYQSQLFGRKGDFNFDTFLLGDIVTRGLIGHDDAARLLPVFGLFLCS